MSKTVQSQLSLITSLFEIKMNKLSKLLFAAVGTGVTVYIGYKIWVKKKILKEKRANERREEFRLSLDKANIHLICTEHDWEKVVPHLQKGLQTIKLLGFDCEWVSKFGQAASPVSLLQLATLSGTCVLVRLCKLQVIPVSLRELLSDRSILKVGVACLDDANKLQKQHHLVVHGCVDLRNLAVRSRLMTSQENRGLKTLADNVLDVKLDKSDCVRRSNWEADTLTEEQVFYSGQDALVAVYIFLGLIDKKMISGGRSKQQTTKQQTNKDFWLKALSMCQGIMDVNFSGKTPKPTKAVTPMKKTPEKQVTRAYVSRNSPLYHNCQLQAPDGQILCTCDLKKAHWYLQKDLADKVSDEPLTVRLKFEPSGRPLNEMNYYVQEKHNICVICGQSESYIRKNVVPHEYRKHFPAVMKDHRSHDVVLLCLACHQKSCIYDNELKEELEIMCSTADDDTDNAKYVVDQTTHKVKSAARALLGNNPKMPPKRRDDLTTFLKLYYGVDELDEDLLHKAISLDPKVPNKKFVPRGQKVVQYMMEHGGLVTFEKMWRRHFLDTMAPLHLPPMWSVNHSHDELTSRDMEMRQSILETSY